MQAVRRKRLEGVVQRELSEIIAQELKDPRVPPLQISGVEVTPDGSAAMVSIALSTRGQDLVPGNDSAIPGDHAERMRQCLEGLRSASGYLRRTLGFALSVRHIPMLSFREDLGLENAIRVHDLLRKLDEHSS